MSGPVPRISVVIPCYNAERWLPETLDSVARQRLTGVEVILVDDGSTDQSVKVAREILPDVQVIRTERVGPSRARNVGTAAARGRFLQYLDADDLLGDGKLERQANLLDETGGDIAYGDWQRLELRDDGAHEPGAVVTQQLDGEVDVVIFSRFWSPPAAYLFRRGIVDRVGGWNERLPVIQDARFVLDCALRGGRFVRTEGLCALYRVHRGGSVSTRDPRAFLRDCLRNACEVRTWWAAQGGITPARRDALLGAYAFVARSTYTMDPETFEIAVSEMHDLDPSFVPPGSAPYRWAARLMGYRRAEWIATTVRRVRGRVLTMAKR